MTSTETEFANTRPVKGHCEHGVRSNRKEEKGKEQKNKGEIKSSEKQRGKR